MNGLYVLDTDVLSLWQHGHEAVCRHVAARAPEELSVTIITVQEQLDGWRTRLPHAKKPKQIADLYKRLADTVRFLSQIRILDYTEAAVARYDKLKKRTGAIGKNDLRIAAIVLEHQATLVTRNQSDFGQISGLTSEDWSQ